MIVPFTLQEEILNRRRIRGRGWARGTDYPVLN